MNEQTELLKEMCELLRVIAGPELAKRDETRRKLLRELVGKSKKKAKAVHLMDGSRNQVSISKESGLDAGELSRLTKGLRTKDLIASGDNPKLALWIPQDLFETLEK